MVPLPLPHGSMKVAAEGRNLIQICLSRRQGQVDLGLTNGDRITGKLNVKHDLFLKASSWDGIGSEQAAICLLRKHRLWVIISRSAFTRRCSSAGKYLFATQNHNCTIGGVSRFINIFIKSVKNIRKIKAEFYYSNPCLWYIYVQSPQVLTHP